MLNENLSKGVFLDSSSHITAADFFCFCQVFQHVSEMEDFCKSEVPNVYRWLLQIQDMEGVKEVLGNLGFSRMDELPFGLQPPKPKGASKKGKQNKQKKQKKQPKKKKEKKKKQKSNVAPKDQKSEVKAGDSNVPQKTDEIKETKEEKAEKIEEKGDAPLA